jgi:hypothetical protein
MLPDSVNQFSYVVLLFDFNQNKSKVIVYKELSLGKAYVALSEPVAIKSLVF